MSVPKPQTEAGPPLLSPGFDIVTGVPNRTLFLSKVKTAVEHGKRQDILALIYLHVDNYHEIHTTFDGRVNPLIGAIAGRIQRILGPEDYLGRVQHHAFAILLTQSNDLSEVANRCNEIRAAFETSFQIDEHRVGVKLSIGLRLGSHPMDPRSCLSVHDEQCQVASHPNVIELIETGIFHCRCYMVMENCAGETLRDKLRRETKPLERVMNYALEIAEGLAALHKKGIVHGDLKPENIFITDDDRIQLFNFGYAKFVQLDELKLFETGERAPSKEAMGTLRYMSPEQAIGKSIDERSDIFSFGSLCYEMLCGKPAFEGSDTVNILNAILQVQPRFLSSLQIPVLINMILVKCLSKSPSERFRTATELALALRCCLHPSRRDA